MASPLLLIVAHVTSDDFQLTCVVRFSVVLLENVPVAVNCSVLPTTRLVLAGVTAIDCNTAAVTVKPVEPVIPSKVAEIVTGPGLTAVASPLLLIVAHVTSDDFQLTCVVRFSVVLLENVPVAVNCSVFPAARLVLAGVTAIDCNTAAVTVIAVEPVIPSKVAEIVTAPGLTAMASPLLLIVAHVTSDDFQLTSVVRFSVVLLESVPVAVNCSVFPDARLVLAGVTAIDCNTAAVTVKPVEPVIPSKVAEIVTAPGLTAVASPLLLIVAHVTSDDFQLTSVVRFSVVLLESVPVAVNCSVFPDARLVLAGVTAIDCNTAAVTVKPVEPVIPSKVAEIVTAPGLTAVASPLLLIVAHVTSDDFQLTSVVRFSVVLLENVPVAVNCSVFPAARLVLAGVTAIDCNTAAVTVSAVEPVIPSRVAEIVTGPGLTAVASPLLLIVAHVTSDDFQLTCVVRFSVVLSEKVPVALNCSVSPAGRLVFTGVTVIDCKTAAADVTVNPVEPVMRSKVAEIVTAPGLTAAASPLLLIVAHVTSDDFQLTSVVRFSVVLLERVPVAVNCSVLPTARLVLAGVTAIDCNTAAVTVKPVEPVIPSKVAEIVTAPGLTAVASPLLLIVAHVTSDDFQVTSDVRFSVELSEKVPVAVNCSVSPTGKLVLAGVTVIDFRVAALTVSTVEPVMPSSEAPIFDVPVAKAVARPCVPDALEIVATEVVADAHVT